eukprot:1138490-Pelagomonas_calceolata.AAC.4
MMWPTSSDHCAFAHYGLGFRKQASPAYCPFANNPHLMMWPTTWGLRRASMPAAPGTHSRRRISSRAAVSPWVLLCATAMTFQASLLAGLACLPCSPACLGSVRHYRDECEVLIVLPARHAHQLALA